MTRTPVRGETTTPDRFTALPDHQTLDETVVALEDHEFSVDVRTRRPPPRRSASRPAREQPRSGERADRDST